MEIESDKCVGCKQEFKKEDIIYKEKKRHFLVHYDCIHKIPNAQSKALILVPVHHENDKCHE